MIQRVRIETKKNDSILPTNIWVGDTELHGVTDICMRLAVDEIPQFDITVNALPENINTIGEVNINVIEPLTLEQIIKQIKDYACERDGTNFYEVCKVIDKYRPQRGVRYNV